MLLKENISDALIRIMRLLLINPATANTVFNKLHANDILDAIPRAIFEAIYSLHTNDRLINTINILAEIKIPSAIGQNQLLEFQTKVSDYLTQVQQAPAAFAESLDELIDIVKLGSVQNKLKNFTSYIDNLNISYSNYLVIFDELRKELLNILADVSNASMKTIREVVELYYEKLEDFKNKKQAPDTIATGYREIETFTNGGFRPGELVIIAARPALGKTTFALNMIINNVDKLVEYNQSIMLPTKPKCIVVFSLEMTNEQVLKKMIAAKTLIPNQDIEKLSFLQFANEANKQKYSLFEHQINEIKHWPIFIDDKPELTILDIESRLHEIYKTNDIAFVIIDYLQLISIGNQAKNSNRAIEVGKISQKLKIIAKELNTPVIAIAQLSRRAEERSSNVAKNPLISKMNMVNTYDDSAPKLSDLRESGSIEQDADIVAFIHYDRSKITNQEKNNEQPNSQRYDHILPVKFIIEKNRSGSTGYVLLTFNKQISKFFSFGIKKTPV